MTQVTKRSTKTRRANRHSVDEIVIQPAAKIAKYRAAWVTGLSFWIWAIGSIIYWFFNFDAVVNLFHMFVLFILGSILIGYGWGGDSNVRFNFKIFLEEIVNSFVDDVDEEIHDSGERLRPITKSDKPGTDLIAGKYNFTVSEWADFFEETMARDNKFNTVTIRNLSHLFPNPTQTEGGHRAEFKRMEWVGDDDKLTHKAFQWAQDHGIIASPTE